MVSTNLLTSVVKIWTSDGTEYVFDVLVFRAFSIDCIDYSECFPSFRLTLFHGTLLALWGVINIATPLQRAKGERSL